jgi:hypothetical protein
MGKRGVGRGLERVRGVGCRESSHGIIAFILQYEERERGMWFKDFLQFLLLSTLRLRPSSLRCQAGRGVKGGGTKTRSKVQEEEPIRGWNKTMTSSIPTFDLILITLTLTLTPLFTTRTTRLILPSRSCHRRSDRSSSSRRSILKVPQSRLEHLDPLTLLHLIEVLPLRPSRSSSLVGVGAVRFGSCGVRSTDGWADESVE